MAAALFGLLFLLAIAVGQNLRARRRELEALEAESAEARDRDHFLMCVGFNDARVFGLIDRDANPMPPEDIQ